MYSETVMDHFNNPRNMGEMGDHSGVGEVGNAACGDIMKIWLKINEEGVITDAKFKTFGCASAIASSSISTEMIIGKHIDAAREVSNEAIVEALDGLPAHKIHCSVLASEAINRAIDDFLGIEKVGADEIVCICNQITRGEIEEAITRGSNTLDSLRSETGVTDGACKGLQCGSIVKGLLKKFELADSGHDDHH